MLAATVSPARPECSCGTVVEVPPPGWWPGRWCWPVSASPTRRGHRPPGQPRCRGPGPPGTARLGRGLVRVDRPSRLRVSSGVQSVRFFPVYPFAARVLGWLPGMGVGPALVLLANLCALARRWPLGGPRAQRPRRGGTRPPLGLAARAGTRRVLTGARVRGRRAPAALRDRHGAGGSEVAVVVGRGNRAGRGWLRPLGLLLVVPVVIEVWRPDAIGGTGCAGSRPRRAVLAPLAGAGAYLGWVGAQFGDPWLPLRVQQQGGHRGPLAAPFAAMWHNATSVLHGHHLGSALHIPWVVLCVVLLVVAFARLPVSYGAFAAAVLAVSLTSSNLDSFERYALGAFPLVIAASTLTARRSVEMVVLIGSAVADGRLRLSGLRRDRRAVAGGRPPVPVGATKYPRQRSPPSEVPRRAAASWDPLEAGLRSCAGVGTGTISTVGPWSHQVPFAELVEAGFAGPVPGHREEVERGRSTPNGTTDRSSRRRARGPLAERPPGGGHRWRPRGADRRLPAGLGRGPGGRRRGGQRGRWDQPDRRARRLALRHRGSPVLHQGQAGRGVLARDPAGGATSCCARG